MKSAVKWTACAAVFLALTCGILRQQSVRAEASSEPVRIGAVAGRPSTVTVFKGLTRYLNKNGFRSEYVLYSSYDSLVAALNRGEVDIAWNTPLAHAQFHVANQCSSRTLIMRDVDFNIRSTVIARADSNIDSLDDLEGARLVLGSSRAAEATVLPVHFLKQHGLQLEKMKIISLEKELDNEGNPCSSPRHVVEALRQNRGDAGIITLALWNRIKNDSTTKDALKRVWTSPPFSHCVFTASGSFDEQQASRFKKLMTNMDPHDPATADVMRLEGTRRWLLGSPKGFESLVDALQSQ